MNNLSIIVARGKNNEIGRDNTLIWHLPDDLKFFRSKTNGKTIVMGYNTFKSLPHMLPNRNHVVLTHKNITIEKYNENNEIEKTVEIKNKNDVNKLFEICDKISLDQDETTENLWIKSDIVVNLQNGLTLFLQEGLDDYCFYKTEDISCTIKTPEGLLDFVNNALKD